MLLKGHWVVKGKLFLYSYSHFWHQMWVFYDKQFWCLTAPQMKGSVSQDCSPLQMPIASLGFQHFWLYIEGFYVPFLRFNNLLEQLTQLRRWLSLLLPVHCKGYNPGIAKWKRCIRQGTWEGMWSFHALSGYAILPAPWYVHQHVSAPNLFV